MYFIEKSQKRVIQKKFILLPKTFAMQDTVHALDQIRLNFSPAALHSLNIAIAVVMFGVALEIKFDHFKALM